jgi:hypothetical protein
MQITTTTLPAACGSHSDIKILSTLLLQDSRGLRRNNARTNIIPAEPGQRWVPKRSSINVMGVVTLSSLHVSLERHESRLTPAIHRSNNQLECFPERHSNCA